MTELMKMYEKTNPVTVPAFLADEYNQLKLENIALKDQLRWRTVSGELPKEGVDILIMDSKQTLIAERIGQFFTHDGISIRAEFFTHWLPIPPAPEGD